MGLTSGLSKGEISVSVSPDEAAGSVCGAEDAEGSLMFKSGAPVGSERVVVSLGSVV